MAELQQIQLLIGVLIVQVAVLSVYLSIKL